jgi:prepilin-type N-terminal cleavage/methylation domain-containing protein
MSDVREAGFTLAELMVVVIVMGLLLLFTVPAIKSFTKSQDLKSASASVRDQLVMAREKAIATGQTQTIRFMKNFSGCDYHIWNGTVANPKWNLPKGVTYAWDAGTVGTYDMTSDGQCQENGLLILVNDKGDRDTISVRLSGLVLRY